MPARQPNIHVRYQYDILNSNDPIVDAHYPRCLPVPSIEPYSRYSKARVSYHIFWLTRNRTLAIAYIRGADKSRYGMLIAEQANNYARGKDECPVDLSDAYSALVDYATPTNTAGGGRRKQCADQQCPDCPVNNHIYLDINVGLGSRDVRAAGRCAGL
jgi:hypothetical protein